MSRLSMRKISEILRHRFELKRSYLSIAQSLNISKSTVYEYLVRAKKAGISWPLQNELSEQELYDKLFLPGIPKAKSKPLPDWEKTHRELRKKGMTLLLLWREYRDIHIDGLGYTQFCQRYRDYVKT